MGDAAHVARCEADPARCEGHVLGNAFDVTHDPANGPDGEQIASMAQGDPRTAYVIWNRRIWSRKRESEGWREYTGPNPHTKHVHVSIVPEKRDSAGPWPWAPELTPKTQSASGETSAPAKLRGNWQIWVAAGLGAWAAYQWAK